MANTWVSVSNIPGALNPDTMILLTDGSLFVHHAYGSQFYILAPDDQGRYESGTWTGPYAMANTRQFFASGVLMDGRVFAIGGEYSDAGNATPLGEIFDPVTKLWSALNKPSSMNFINSDAVSCVLADGRVIFGSPGGTRTAIWDPVIDLWTELGLAFGASASPTKSSNTNEESWSLMPDGTVLTVQVNGAPAAEKYVPSTDRWVSAASTPSTLPLVSLKDPVSKNQITIKEIGPGLTLPDGRCFFVGGTGKTALYTQGASPGQPGSWVAGPNLPADTTANKYNQVNGNLQTAIDAPGTLLPNGQVLLIAGNTVREVNNGAIQFWSNPCTCYLFDQVANTISALAPQPGNNGVDTWQSRLLTLPTGQVAFTTQTGGVMQILTIDAAVSAPNAAWKPVITGAPSSVLPGHTYSLTGTQFNGLSQTSSYGDDAGVATNYPIARMKKHGSNKINYLRSFAFSSLGIATGATPQTVSVKIPANLTPGVYDLVVVANGIPSDPVTVRVSQQDCFFIIDRSTFSQGEIQALINLNGAPATIDDALYVVVEGFQPSELGLNAGNLNNPPSKPAVTSPIPGMTFQFSGPVVPQDPSLPPNAQRFTYPFKVAFADTSMFGFAASTANVGITASMTAAGNTVTAAALLQLMRNPNPYILHGDTAHGGDWYLSVDLRVFQAKAGQTRFAAHVPTAGSARAAATGFIQQVLHNLNGSPASANSIFDSLPTAEDQATLALAPTDSAGTAVYNFALARVRYRDTIPASNVRLFFRMWPAQQTNASFDTNTLYRSASSGTHKVPLLGVQGDEIMTIPFFATPRVDTTSASMRTQADTPNVRAISPDSLGGEVSSFFGCWLDINQPNDRVLPARLVGPTPANLPDGPFSGLGQLLPVQQLVRSAHQCLIAEVAFDLAPVQANSDPSTSDKLAQRNLTFVNVPNPGLLDSRRAPQTFEVRPTPAQYPADVAPDELMLDWGNIPHGTTANLYLPACDADEILSLADQLYDVNLLTKVDDHTIACPAGGVTYLPVPRGSGVNFAGLLSVELPAGIRKGHVHEVTVRQVTTALSRLPAHRATRLEDDRPINAGGAPGGDGDQPTEAPAVAVFTEGFQAKRPDLSWRRVLGVFNLTIPVSTKGELRPGEERLLSLLRWIQVAIPMQSRWFLVFKRYLDEVADRVRDMGGDPDAIGADPNGDWKHVIPSGGKHGGERGYGDRDDDSDADDHGYRRAGERLVRFTGKVASLEYDRYGDYDAFLLDTEDGLRRFEGREVETEELAERVWRDRTTISVYAERHDPDRPVKIVLHAASAALED